MTETQVGISINLFAFRIPFTKLKIEISKVILEGVQVDEAMKEIALIQSDQNKKPL